MDPWEKLRELLIEATGCRNVYFQPPENYRMEYPCIVFSQKRIDSLYANNKPYLHSKCYSVTAIDRDPDSGTPERIAALPKCRHENHFVSDNLYHDVFTLYYSM